MKTNIVTFAGATALVVALAIGFAIVRPVLAQVAATSTDATASSTSPTDTIASPTQPDSSSTPAVESLSISTSPVQTSPADATTTTENSSQTGPSVEGPSIEPAPTGLKLIHIIGTKYIDYFTDGTTTVSFPGDPAIDGNLDKPNAPIPTHAGLTWDHTTGGYLYDTPSGDLELGDYAVQP